MADEREQEDVRWGNRGNASSLEYTISWEYTVSFFRSGVEAEE